MQSFIRRLLRLPVRPQRLELRVVGYAEADHLIRTGAPGEWAVASEEDHNNDYGVVWMERLSLPTREA